LSRRKKVYNKFSTRAVSTALIFRNFLGRFKASCQQKLVGEKDI